MIKTRAIIFEIDADTGARSVNNIIEYVGKSAAQTVRAAKRHCSRMLPAGDVVGITVETFVDGGSSSIVFEKNWTIVDKYQG